MAHLKDEGHSILETPSYQDLPERVIVKKIGNFHDFKLAAILIPQFLFTDSVQH